MFARLGASALIVVVLIAGYISVLAYSQSEAGAREADTVIGDAGKADRLDVTAKLISVSPDRGEAAIRLSFQPSGRYAESSDSPLLAVPVRLLVNTANSAQDRVLEKGKLVTPFDAVIDLAGSVSDYPFDKYSGELVVAALDNSDPKNPVEIPVVLNFQGAIHGFSVTPGAIKGAGTSDAISLDITRSPTTLAVSLAISLLLGLMAIVVLVLVITIAVFGRKLEPPIIALMGALLFGFVAFRNAAPGTPAIGTFSDYLAFFWAEAIVAVALFTFVILYFRRTLAAK